MHTAALIVAGLVAALHVWFAILEGVLFTKPLGLKTFKISAEDAETCKVFAQNQGLYNLFLSAGLVWSFVAEPGLAFQLQLFFLGCVIVAGVVGGVTASKGILFVQALPAAIALVLVLGAGASA
ncbi:MAG: DUF1304 domain-containing protein [Planctomycetes bacterium]|nr:DUF1304 domain-containing protein [Planctomycetota bacterium]